MLQYTLGKQIINGLPLGTAYVDIVIHLPQLFV